MDILTLGGGVTMKARDIVDIDRYPIEDLNSHAAQDLIARCRRDLDEDAICVLEGFVRPQALAEMAAEGRALVPRAYSNANLRTPYAWMCNKGFPEDHPRSALFLNAKQVVLTHQFPGDGAIERLYHWDPLTNFVREALGFQTLYRSACPHLSLMLSSMGEGGQLGWHFDTNDGVVSLLIDAPDSGGEFECAPYIRSEEDENYDAVSRLFSGDETLVVRPPMRPGSFILFKGRRSCHRVAEVGPTETRRLIALFSYDEKPGMVFPEKTCQDLMTPSSEPYLGQQA